MLRPDAIDVFKIKRIQECCVIIQEVKSCETTFALQGPEVKTKPNPRLEGPRHLTFFTLQCI